MNRDSDSDSAVGGGLSRRDKVMLLGLLLFGALLEISTRPLDSLLPVVAKESISLAGLTLMMVSVVLLVKRARATRMVIACMCVAMACVVTAQGARLLSNMPAGDGHYVVDNRTRAYNILLDFCDGLPPTALALGFFLLVFQINRTRILSDKRARQLRHEVKERVRSEEALRVREQQYHSILQSAMDGFWIIDAEGKFLDVNETYCEMLGYSREELLRMSVADIEVIDKPERMADRIERLIREGERRFETQHRVRDGAIRDVEVSVTYHPLLEARFFGFVRDITEQKRAREDLREYAQTQAVLLREVNHRVKNNLATIAALLKGERSRMQRDETIRCNEALDGLIGRVGGLSTVHSLLSASNWRPLRLSAVCEAVLGGVGEGTPTSGTLAYTVAASDVMVTSSQAHHLALVVNELATNAMKHAGDERGSVKVDIGIDAHDGMAFLSFRDHGPGFPSEMLEGDFAQASVGFELIYGIVRHSCGGDIELRNDHGGVAVVSFQLESPDGDES